MISTADALDVMTTVAACHRRTAPRMDDEQAAMATAAVWAEIFNDHKLELPDLLAAVKKRAAFERDAPEPAEVIHYARQIRQARDADTGPTPEYEALCESKAEDAAELAALRQAREQQPAIERPGLKTKLAEIAGRREVPAEMVEPS